MRIAALMIAVAVVGFGGMLGSAQAVPAIGGGVVGNSPNIVEVDRRCGPYHYYNRGHRNRAGHFIRGHCVRNRRR